MQVTVPLMFEGIHDVIASSVTGAKHPLASTPEWQDNMVLVTQDWFVADFFRSRPSASLAERDNHLAWVTKDVLGFLSMVVSMAKSAKILDPEDFSESQGPKVLSMPMLRSWWTTAYDQVKHKIPGQLWDIVEILSCYKMNSRGKPE